MIKTKKKGCVVYVMYEIGQEVHNKNFHGKILDIVQGKYSKMYVYECLICHCKDSKGITQVHNGIGCSVCAKRKIVKGVNDIATTDPWMVGYFQDINDAYTHASNSGKKLPVKCKYCGRNRDSPMSPNSIYMLHGISCPCRDKISFPNKVIFAVMEQLKEKGEIIDFKRELPITDGIKNYSVDMAFYDKNLCQYFVEMDSKFGHGYEVTGDVVKKDIFESLSIDYAKDKFADKYDARMIRIPIHKNEKEYVINQFEQSELSRVVNLTLIDWDKVFMFAYDNIIKEVCDYKRDHPDAFSSETAKIFKLCKDTVSKYWQYGDSVGWCDFEHPELERARYKKERPDNRKNRIPLTVSNEDESIVKQYNHIIDFVKNSLSDFGVKTSTSTLYRNLKNGDFIYKGLTIKKEDN